jgi:hypothetical protein
MTVPKAKPNMALVPNSGSKMYPNPRPKRMLVTLKAEDAEAGSPKLPRLLSKPM